MRQETFVNGDIIPNSTLKQTLCHDNYRLENSPSICVFKYARVVKQKVWNEAENRERDGGETLKIRPRPTQARALRARKTLTPSFTGFFTDFEKKKTTVFQSMITILVRSEQSLKKTMNGI